MDRLLDSREVGALLKIKARTLDIWRGLGKGPTFVKIGSRVRYERQAVEEWVKQNIVHRKEKEK